MSDLKSCYDLDYVERVARELGAGEDFVSSLWPMLDELEMKGRTIALADAIHAHCGGEFQESAKAVDHILELGGWTGFDAWPLLCVVERHGLSDVEESLGLLRKWTGTFTSEFAIRPFLNQDFDGVLDVLRGWRNDKDEHVRRLVTEGTRPRLPWGPNVKSIDKNFEAIVDLISPLRLDSSEYVRRSVANHLNDWTKLQPTTVKALLQGWGDSDHEVWVKKRALRSLVKAGDRDALCLLGFRGQVTLLGHTCSKDVSFPGDLEFSVSVTNSGVDPILMALDFAVEHHGKNGLRAPKVFKWKTLSLQPGETQHLQKNLTFKAITTRKYYDGLHVWSVTANGTQLARAEFNLSGVS